VIVTISILSGDGDVVSNVFERAFIAKSSPFSKEIFSSYSSLRNEFAAKLLVPMAVAFHPL